MNTRLAAYYWANRVTIHNVIVQIAKGGGDIPASRRNAAIQALRKFRTGKLPAGVAEMVLGGKTVMYEGVVNALLKRVVAEHHDRIALYFFDVDFKLVKEGERGDAEHYHLSAGYFLYPEVFGVPDTFDPRAIEAVVAVRTPAELDELVDKRIAALVRRPVLGAKKIGEVEEGDAVMVASLTAVREGKRWEQGCGRNLVLFTKTDEWPASTPYADQLVGAKAKDRKTLTVEVDGIKTDLHIHIDQVHQAVLADPEQIAKQYGYPSVEVWRTRLRKAAEEGEVRLERDSVKQAIVNAMRAYDVKFDPFPDYWAVRHIEKLRESGFTGPDWMMAEEVSRVFHETVLLREFGRRVGTDDNDGIDGVIDWAVKNLKIERITTESNRALADAE